MGKGRIVNRRGLLRGLGVIGVGTVVARVDLRFPGAVQGQAVSKIRVKSSGLPATVAGIRLVDSPIARRAVELSRESSPPYMFNHAIRTYLFGSLIGRALGQEFDDEIFFLACVLHDLGLTERFQGDLPFEIQGAQAAKHFLQENAYSKDGTEMVWDGIAMHPAAIGQFKRPEIALVGAGAGTDVVGPDFEQVKKKDVDEIVAAFPRLDFKTSFLKSCADVIRKHPRSASRTFMRDIGERYVKDYHPKNFCEAVAQAPFAE
jgi:hypothetical protein